MSPLPRRHEDAFIRAAAAVPSCALDEEGRRDQAERLRALAPAVERIDREEDVLVVEFGPKLDRDVLEEMIAVERRCCPSFAFSFDEIARRLIINVDDPQAWVALDAIAYQLEASG